MSDIPEQADRTTIVEEIESEGISLPELSSDTHAPVVSDAIARDNEANPISMDTLKDVPVTITAVLGKKRVDVASLLSLEKNSIIDIDRKIGEPIDLYVNNTLVAKGELVMVEGSLGISMTEIIQEQDTPLLSPETLSVA